LATYEPEDRYPEDQAALACVQEALRGAELGGYGIGAALVNAAGEVLHIAHNRQLQCHRSDLHAEMQLLNEFEELPQFSRYLAKPEFTGQSGTFFTEPLTLYASTEPCPMCFTRLVIVGVKVRYVAPGPDDGMASRAQKLPRFWYELSRRYEARPAKASPVLRQLAHVLFYSYLLE
jgi:tRNA(Arg) A34 adenosine deaminase TadA